MSLSKQRNSHVVAGQESFDRRHAKATLQYHFLLFLLLSTTYISKASTLTVKVESQRRTFRKHRRLQGEASFSPSSIPSIRPTNSYLPTASPTNTLSLSPSWIPSSSYSPSSTPTMTPSRLPSWIPSSSHVPSPSPTLTQAPSISLEPTLTPTSSPSQSPTNKPTAIPTRVPTSSPSTSIYPSFHPTRLPSRSPTDKPTLSMSPSISPSNLPTSSPTLSMNPSSSPTESPTSQPTYSFLFQARLILITTFISSDAFDENDPEEVRIFQETLSGYTPLFGNEIRDPNHIVTECNILSSSYASSGSGSGQAILQYSIDFESRHENITGYDDRFFNFIQNNTEIVILDLKDAGIRWKVDRILFSGRANTKTPTRSPTLRPSNVPSMRPSHIPSISPSYIPSARPSISMTPSDMPSNIPTLSSEPTAIPSIEPTIFIAEESRNLGAIMGGAIGGATFILLCFLGRRQRRRRINIGKPDIFSLSFWLGQRKSHESDDTGVPSGPRPERVILDNQSVISRDSLISSSSENDDSGSDVEYGESSVFHDEFEKYKDENMEKMRKQVVQSLADCGDMVNLALTKALMDDMDDDDSDDITSGGAREGIEVEATVLCEMTDWMKKSENASADERREVMQDTLNSMVSNVRRGIISSEDGTRIIHGAAVILGLQLELTLPDTTLIVTGMRKKATKKDMVEAFKEFGEIQDAAVSSNSRGFGLVRYRSPKSVQRAVNRYRTGEIVVQDVAIMIKVLKPESFSSSGLSDIDLTRQLSNERRTNR